LRTSKTAAIREEAMPREATRTVRRTADGFAARITVVGRTRRYFSLASGLTEPQAEERTKDLSRMALRLRLSGHSDKVEQLMAAGAKARPGRHWAAVVDAVDMLCNGEAERAKEVPTFGSFAQDWTSGELARKYPDHVRRKRSAERDEELLRLYVLPHVRDVRLDEFDLHDAPRACRH
jgi:hypothetical protein